MNNTNHMLIKNGSGFFRKEAKERLRGNWEKAVIATLIYMAVVSLLSSLISDFAPSLQWVGFVYMLIIMGPMQFGYAFFLLNLFRKREIQNDMLFRGFEQFIRTFLLGIFIFIFVFLWSLLLIIPGIVAMYRYAMAFYILADNPEISPFEAIKRSKEMMRGNKGNLFMLHLSYFGWLVLTMVPVWIFFFILAGDAYLTGINFGADYLPTDTFILILCGGILWVNPYINMGSIAFYEVLNPQDNLSKEEEDLMEETAEIIADYLAIKLEEKKDE